MKGTLLTISLLLVFVLFSVATGSAQTPGFQQQQPEFLRQGQQLMREGKLEDALALYRQTLQTSPNSIPANTAAGSVLDLMGQGEEARKYFQKAIDAADTPEQKAMAERAMAVSYGFEAKSCSAINDHERKSFDYYGSVKNFYQQGEVADEAGRLCLDSDDLHNRYPADDVNTAYQWYKLGHDTGLKEPNISPARTDLWEFRWQSAQARIAARQGQRDEAQKHVEASKAILDRGTNPEQAQFLPYLRGYVAFFLRDYKMALDELLNANQNDAFVQCLIGQTYEKLGEKAKAVEFYRKAAAATFHNPPAAYAVPFSKTRLATLGSSTSAVRLQFAPRAE